MVLYLLLWFTFAARVGPYRECTRLSLGMIKKISHDSYQELSLLNFIFPSGQDSNIGASEDLLALTSEGINTLLGNRNL